ncbi:hypothetical protein OOK27_48075 [Streptomyces canus]|uniref:hypothetical protein n=1 Tax=Streptomyces canus TaxID=58343 RepID=UPI002257E003|nr:hypothetical protein [Streptomyces canus]MCX5261800.1 hypothetical protein [Streptomyces canus]
MSREKRLQTGNITAWALAGAWCSSPLYPFHGPVVAAGRAQDGVTAGLDDELAEHDAVASAVSVGPGVRCPSAGLARHLLA